MSEDLPPGPWSELLVGHHWPAASSLSALQAAVAQRDAVAAAHDGYADTLASIASSTLAPQSGLTADSIRARFEAGRSTSYDVLRRQDELQHAQLKEARALVDVRLADAAVDALTGAILDHFGLGLRP